jgi:hypothetical protein
MKYLTTTAAALLLTAGYAAAQDSMEIRGTVASYMGTGIDGENTLTLESGEEFVVKNYTAPPALEDGSEVTINYMEMDGQKILESLIVEDEANEPLGSDS